MYSVAEPCALQTPLDSTYSVYIRTVCLREPCTACLSECRGYKV